MGLEDASLPAVPRDDDRVGRGLLQRVTFHSIPLYTRTWKPNSILSCILAHYIVKYQSFKITQYRGLKTTFKDYEMARVKQVQQVEPKLSKKSTLLLCLGLLYGGLYTVSYSSTQQGYSNRTVHCRLQKDGSRCPVFSNLQFVSCSPRLIYADVV